MGGLGHWAMDWLSDTGMHTDYFPDRETARRSGVSGENGFTLRRVNLEDAFLHLTGKKVDHSPGGKAILHGGHSGNHSSHGHHSNKHNAHGSHGTHGKKGH
jgi:ABC-2 type transport system ATP-binding protein